MQGAGLEESLAPPGIGGPIRGLADGSDAEGGLSSLAAFSVLRTRTADLCAGQAKGQLPALGVSRHGPGSEEDNQRHRHQDDDQEDEWRWRVSDQCQLPTSTSKGKTMLLP